MNIDQQITPGAYSETIKPKRPPKELFEPFMGHWRLEGKNSDTAAQPGCLLTGKESYEWLPGGYFVVTYWHRQYEGSEHTGVGVLGFDASNEKYFLNMFDNLGFTRSYEVEVLPGMMLIWGSQERASIFLDERKQMMDIQWEHTKDGKTWLPLCDLKSYRLAS